MINEVVLSPTSDRPSLSALLVGAMSGNAVMVALCVSWLPACADSETRRLSPVSVALSQDSAAVYDDGELTIYEAKASLMLPIIAPRADQLDVLWEQESDPFDRRPWVTREDIEVQVTWTLSNLDPVPHSIWVMLDPWNEFGRYEPAIVVSDDEAVRDLSGIDMLFLLPGVTGDAQVADDPRIVGTFTFDDMDELALDFATVFKILSDVVPSEDTAEDPRSTLVNHAFNVRNRSYNSPLLAPYRPLVVPGLVGFDFGVRSVEPANVALEIAVEVRDRRGDRVAQRGQAIRLLEPPEPVISAGPP
jgi:hypothetical protein